MSLKNIKLSKKQNKTQHTHTYNTQEKIWYDSIYMKFKNRNLW